MKKCLLLVLMLVFNLNYLLPQNVTQEKKVDVKYRRSSLHTILIESEKFPYKDTVIKAYYNAPFPDKYNNHTIGEKSFDPMSYGYKPGDTVSYRRVIDKYFAQNKIANKLVAKWFNRQPDGTFDMSLIGERGSYNASEMEAHIARNSARGITSLADAGEELISNTFVVVSKLLFISNEIPAAIAREVAKKAANRIQNEFARQAAYVAADIAYEKAKEGYSVWTTSYLYRLVWNDSVAAVFYNDLWMDKNSMDPVKKEKFDNTDLFQLQFIGDEFSKSLVTFSFKEQRSEEKIVEIATIRNVDAVYAKLQKKYDVFKTKTPLYTGYPITAKIGLKEGLEGGERFEVLEQVIDKDGRTKYERRGVITVDKKKIWDNRYNAGEGPGEKMPGEGKPQLDRTFFNGGKNYYAGLLIRQIK